MSDKNLILRLILLFAAAAGLAEPFWPPEGGSQLLVNIGMSLAFGTLIAQWCRLDAAANGQSFPLWLLWLIVLLGVPALLIHLFRSRSPVKALRATGLAIGFAFLAAGSLVAGALTSTLWLCETNSIAAFCKNPI